MSPGHGVGRADERGDERPREQHQQGASGAEEVYAVEPGFVSWIQDALHGAAWQVRVGVSDLRDRHEDVLEREEEDETDDHRDASLRSSPRSQRMPSGSSPFAGSSSTPAGLPAARRPG